jgi:hypothetical protein
VPDVDLGFAELQPCRTVLGPTLQRLARRSMPICCVTARPRPAPRLPIFARPWLSLETEHLSSTTKLGLGWRRMPALSLTERPATKVNRLRLRRSPLLHLLKSHASAPASFRSEVVRPFIPERRAQQSACR